MNKRHIAPLAAAFLFAALFAFLKYGGIAPAALWTLSRDGTWFLPLVTAAAVVDSVNPCAFSILLLTIAFLFSIGALRSRILALGSAYISGLFLTYLLIGLGILQALHLFNTPHFMGKIGAVLLAALGAIAIANEFFPSFPIRLRIPAAAHGAMAVLVKKGSLPAAFALGSLVGLCEFPCTGGPYLMILGLLHDRGTYLRGFGYLIYYNLLFILPLAIILAVAANPALLEKVRAWKRTEHNAMRLWGGFAMILLGAAIFIL